ncbi:MAG: DNA-binding response regulator [Chloroflexi bacterium RBG_16_56_8]|nr:MAG: DNA-binding response regulator [Chloroflexi bacterium RBG_16_56_8]
MERIRILIADDHEVVREGLTAIISAQADMTIVAQAADGAQAVTLAHEKQPDVILLDLSMPHKDGLAAIREIKRANADARILVLTSFDDDERVFPAIKAGALGYLLKDTPRTQLLAAIRDVACGRASLHPTIAMKMMRELRAPEPARSATASPSVMNALTPRETETLQLIARGLGNRAIAETLGVDERTVAKYVSSILSKLHLASRTQAALYALREGLG